MNRNEAIEKMALALVAYEHCCEPDDKYASDILEVTESYRRSATVAFDALGLEPHRDIYWTLYNPAEEAFRMHLGVNDDVWSIEGARERMAPYHRDGDGYEVVECTRTWWSTPPTRLMVPAPVSRDAAPVDGGDHG